MTLPLNDRLRDQRRLRGYSQQALADKLGVGRTTINRTERGLQVPSLDLALRIAETLNTTVDMLFGTPVERETAEAAYERGRTEGYDKGWENGADYVWDEVDALRREKRLEDPHGIAAYVAKAAPAKEEDRYAVWLLRNPGGAKHDAVVQVWVYRRKREQADALYELKTGETPR